MLIYVVIGLLVGILTSMGLGGGSIMIPILYAFGITQKEAQLVNVIFYIPIALIATVINFMHQLVDYKVAIRILITAVIGAVVGAYLSQIISGGVLKKIFALLMIILGLYKLKK